MQQLMARNKVGYVGWDPKYVRKLGREQGRHIGIVDGQVFDFTDYNNGNVFALFPDGTTGTISVPDAFMLELSGPGEWVGHVRTSAGRKGPITTYYVWFDHPTDDGSGDGPYLGAEIFNDPQNR